MTPDVPPPAPEEQTAIRRAAKKLQLPLASGKASVMMLFLCFAISATIVLLLGAMLHMPPWIRFELILAAWWVVWSATLAHLLYHGKRISDDHTPQPARSWFSSASTAKSQSSTTPVGTGWNWGFGGGDPEGCLWAIGILIAIVVLFMVAWLLVEIVIPFLALILYSLIRGMLARVANDDHRCTGRVGAAFFWGTVWATAYTAPLALIVWVIHMIVAYRAAGHLV